MIMTNLPSTLDIAQEQIWSKPQIKDGLRERGYILENTGSAGSVVQAIARCHFLLLPF